MRISPSVVVVSLVLGLMKTTAEGPSMQPTSEPSLAPSESPIAEPSGQTDPGPTNDPTEHGDSGGGNSSSNSNTGVLVGSIVAVVFVLGVLAFFCYNSDREPAYVRRYLDMDQPLGSNEYPTYEMTGPLRPMRVGR
mmetsp:Transcript_18232/g.69121  ORF Transcript_18232/g.69121 Transcript_18232/m.69121 type:complete len:136 (-) Transcript_18232:320-727(-)